MPVFNKPCVALIIPVPVPLLETVKILPAGGAVLVEPPVEPPVLPPVEPPLLPDPLKFAVQALSAVMVNAAVAAVPEQSPLQPVNVEPASAVAVKVAAPSGTKLAVQIVPQFKLGPTPAVAVTPPEPVPVLVTVSTELLSILRIR